MAQSSPNSPTTQRAYTLRLHGANGEDHSWRDALWVTHEAVNKGTKAFGDWLLTLRGGLCHTLADAKVTQGKGRADREPTKEERRNRRILLALSWLSVESAPKDGDRHKDFVIASGKGDCPSSRNERVLQALRKILEQRGVKDPDLAEWLGDCEPSLSAAIRDDAVWVNRSAAFDSLCKRLSGLNRDYAGKTTFSFFGKPSDYLALPIAANDEDLSPAVPSNEGPEFRTLARAWVSTNFGTGEKSDNAAIGKALHTLAVADLSLFCGRTKAELLKHLVALLNGSVDSADPEKTVRIAIGWKTGRPSKGRLVLENLPDQMTKDAIETLQRKFNEEDTDKKEKAGLREVPNWMPEFQQIVEEECGIPFVGNRNHIGEFAVMLDHAARRVSIGHSWIKRAESERQKFQSDAEKINAMKLDVKNWLDQFCQERSGSSGAIEVYRIRKRAIDGWKEVVARWNRTDCQTTEGRIAAAREVQADPDIEKFGDIQLFEALACDGAVCVWHANGEATTQPLVDYVIAKDAQAKQQRFKVPAYRHPDPLSHPVFCDFGNSRWDIRFAVHQAAKAKSKKTSKKETSGKNDWLKDGHALCMGLWDGQKLDNDMLLQWACKRLAKDLALRQTVNNQDPICVTRADRLGRAAVGAKVESFVDILNVFHEDYWNGRLQAPRPQLDAIASHVAKHGWDARAKQMRSHIRWLISFSAKLQAAGPWIDYAGEFSDGDPARPFISRNGEYAVKHETNNFRKGHAKLILSRLPGLRVLSVDLGHRYAAACAVWETLSDKQVKVACQAAEQDEPKETDLYLHLKKKVKKQKKGKEVEVEETTVYRRIGADYIDEVDGGTGEIRQVPHPAPWARLDRQFLIKLPGEEQPPRAASNKGDANETKLVANFVKRLGLVADDERDNVRDVDELMSRAVRIATLGLKRHARRAKIAYALDPSTKAIPSMGGNEKAFTPGDDAHVKFLTDALFDWHSLASESRWDDKPSRDLWNQHIATMTNDWRIEDPHPHDDTAEGSTRQQRRKDDDAQRQRLKPIAEQLSVTDRSAMHAAWKERWERDDGKKAKLPLKKAGVKGPSKTVVETPATGFHAELRWFTDWIMGKHLPGATSRGWKQNVGGLSVTRIATMKSLYQLHKAFAMRSRPDKPRGAPEKGDTNAGVAQSILSAMEHLREQRVKQLASRIAEAALGIGRVKASKSLRDRKRPQQCVDSPCHAVVIENLTNYRPEETRTRRENRQLMDWSSSKVKKYLSEACQLHGLHLREVQAGYTSRQDSRTGAPGVRCSDVPVAEFLSAPWWRKQVNTAGEKVKHGKGDARENYLVDLGARWSAATEDHRKAASPLRIPVDGGEIFVSADHHSPVARGLQADLNAAANIGLKALMDPDWPGKWWFIPCSAKDARPVADKVSGANCIDSSVPLCNIVADLENHGGKKKQKKEITNFWRDPASTPINGHWQHTAKYWNIVRDHVINVLRQAADLDDNTKMVEVPDTPW